MQSNAREGGSLLLQIREHGAEGTCDHPLPLVYPACGGDHISFDFLISPFSLSFATFMLRVATFGAPSLFVFLPTSTFTSSLFLNRR